MAKTLNEKLEAAKLEKEQAEARIKQLVQEQKAEERKARNHRFCKRGGLMEKLLPDLAVLSDEQFESFFKKTTANNYGRNALAEITAQISDMTAPPETVTDTMQDSSTTTTTSTQPATHTETKPAAKTKGTAQTASTNSNSGTSTTSRVAG